jgi:hypothetical protein
MVRSNSDFLSVYIDNTTIKRVEIDLSDIGSTYGVFVGCGGFDWPRFWTGQTEVCAVNFYLTTPSALHSKPDYLAIPNGFVKLL